MAYAVVSAYSGASKTTVTIGGTSYDVYEFASTAGGSSIEFSQPGDVDYLIVAGGGAGHLGDFEGGGGGGAGGMLAGTFAAGASLYPVVVGAGGARVTRATRTLSAQNGGNRSAFGLAAIGGGTGAARGATRAGGIGGGGGVANNSGLDGINGTGGGGYRSTDNHDRTSGAGGSGIVIIRVAAPTAVSIPGPGKLDLFSAKQIKTAAGEWLEAKGPGWHWVRQP